MFLGRLIKKIFKTLFLRLKPQSDSVRNVIKLAGGTAASQVITVAVAPILTRLYGPESFGVLATFVSILGLLNVINSMSYELAISVPEDDEEAMHVFWLCLFLVVCFTALIAVSVLSFGTTFVEILNQPAFLPLLWFLPVGTLFTGIYSALNFWSIRTQRFSVLAQAKVFQSIFGQLCNIVLSPLGPVGLAIGSVVSQSIGGLRLFNKSLFCKPHGLTSQTFSCISFSYILQLLRIAERYKSISINNSIARLLNSFYPFLVSIILSTSGELSSLGLLFFVKRILDTPCSMISRALGDEFFSRVARVEERKLYEVCLLNTKRIALASTLLLAPYGLLLLFFGENIFGSFWDHKASFLILSMIPSSILQLSIGSTGLAFITSNRNFHGLVAQCLMMLSRIMPLIVCLFVNQPQLLPFMYAAGLFIGYIAYGSILTMSLKRII